MLQLVSRSSLGCCILGVMLVDKKGLFLDSFHLYRKNSYLHYRNGRLVAINHGAFFRGLQFLVNDSIVQIIFYCSSSMH